MKFKVTFKNPDAVYQAVQEAAEEYAAGIEGIDGDEREAITETRRAKISEVAHRFFEYGEYCTVEIDTDAGTATVVPTK